MATRSIAGPQLISVTCSKHDKVQLMSDDEVLELRSDSGGHPIFSVVDGNGAVVKSVHRWLRSLRQRAGLSIAPSTVEKYARFMLYLCCWLEKDDPGSNLTLGERLIELSRQDIRAWLVDMEAGGAKSSTTRHTREACVKQFLDWMTSKEAGKLRDPENSPYGRDGSLKYIVTAAHAASPKFLPEEVIVTLLQGFHNECERCMYHAQYDMGLRITEVTNMVVSDFPDDNMYDPSFEFIPICVRRGKGRGGSRPVKTTLISRAVLKRVKRYHGSREFKMAPDWAINDPNKPAFLTTSQLRWSDRNASKQFKNAVRRVGLVDDMSTHWMRHGTAFSVLRSDAGKTLEDRMLLVQQMLGHAHLKTTEIYTHIRADLLQRLTKAGAEMDRLKEAERIRENTYLGPLQHKEKRGHRA